MWIIVRVLIGIAILFLLEYYFTKKITGIFKTLLPQFSARKKKIFLYLFLILLNLYPAILIFNAVYAAITKQSVVFPENFFADYFLLYPFWVLILIIVQVSVLYVFVDLLKFVLYPIYKRHKEKLKRFEVKLFLALTLFFVIYVPARIIYDYNTIDVRSVVYNAKNLPKELDGFKIIFISDVQADRYTDGKRLQKFIDKVNESKPDLVLIAGDVITSTPNYIETAAKYIGEIKSKYGVYSCVGDHDNWAYRNNTSRSLSEVIEALKENNVEMIDNEEKAIKINGADISIAFITNTYVKKINEAKFDSVVGKNLSGDLKILLVHQPSNFLVQKAKQYNFNLLFAGHTHGGQVTFLFPFKNLSPTLFETKYVRGDFHFGNLLMVVTRGLGMSLVPLRYNSTPEVTVIIINPS